MVTVILDCKLQVVETSQIMLVTSVVLVDKMQGLLLVMVIQFLFLEIMAHL